MRELGQGRRRFTLSYHYYAQRDTRNHLELFLDIDENAPLQTWRNYSHTTSAKRTDRRLSFVAAPDHRRIYLDFSGKVTNNRGKLRIVRRGFFVDLRRRSSVGRTAHEVHTSATRWTWMSGVRTAQDVHPDANRRTGGLRSSKSILVTL